MIHKNKAHCQTVSNTIHRSEQSRLPDRGGSTKWVHLHSWLVGKKKQKLLSACFLKLYLAS